MKHTIVSILSEGYLNGWREKRERGGGGIMHWSMHPSKGFALKQAAILLCYRGIMSYRYQIFIPSEPRFFVVHPEKSDIERCVRAIFKHITKSSNILKEMGCSEPT